MTFLELKTTMIAGCEIVAIFTSLLVHYISWSSIVRWKFAFSFLYLFTDLFLSVKLSHIYHIHIYIFFYKTSPYFIQCFVSWNSYLYFDALSLIWLESLFELALWFFDMSPSFVKLFLSLWHKNDVPGLSYSVLARVWTQPHLQGALVFFNGG